MYIVKNAWINIKRSKGRNILIGLIILIVTISSYVALAMNNSSNNLVDSYKNNNLLEVTFGIDMQNFRQKREEDSSSQIPTLTMEDIENYGDSEYVDSYYYYYTTSLSSNQIEAISMSDFFEGKGDMPEDENGKQMMDKGSMKSSDGDFKFLAYSDVSYAESFIDGSNKIIEGEFFDNDSTENVIIISSDLADENSISVGDIITFYSDSDTDTTFEFTVVGIYEDSSDNSDNFTNMNAMVSSNQIYTTVSALENILSYKDTVGNNISAKYYLTSSDDLESFEAEVREKGLSDNYSINNNLDSILSTLEPIQNISNFSLTFLVIVCVVAMIVIGILTMINIRDRKYEIGVLRAIGMSKLKVMAQLLIEITIVTIIAIILGLGIGKIVSQPVTNAMLSSEIEKYTEEQTQIQDNFGGKDFNKGQTMNRPREMKQSVDFVDTLKVEMNPISIIIVTLISLAITLLCGMISIIYVNRYSPNKILQNRG